MSNVAERPDTTLRHARSATRPGPPPGGPTTGRRAPRIGAFDDLAGSATRLRFSPCVHFRKLPSCSRRRASLAGHYPAPLMRGETQPMPAVVRAPSVRVLANRAPNDAPVTVVGGRADRRRMQRRRQRQIGRSVRCADAERSVLPDAADRAGSGRTGVAPSASRLAAVAAPTLGCSPVKPAIGGVRDVSSPPARRRAV